jgi:co-chaperonin GroES (HSP10)
MLLCACGEVPAVREKFGSQWCVKCARLNPEAEVTPLLRPLGDRVVILPEPEKYTGQVILPPSYNPKVECRMGRVLAAGPGASYRKKLTNAHWALDLMPMDSRVGDFVLYRRKFEGTVHDWRGLAICHDFDVLVVLEKEEAAA